MVYPIDLSRERQSISMASGIFQICWNERSFSKLEPGFVAFDWRRNPHPDHREFAAFRELHARGDTRKFDLTGAFSPKFAAKSGVSGLEFKQWVGDNPGYDFYFVDPRPQFPVFFFNGWINSSHQFGSRFLACAREIIELAGYEPDVWINQREDFSNAFCMNFWVAKKEFWDRLMGVIDNILSVDRQKLRPESRSFLFEPRQWRAPNQLPVAQIALVLERVVTSLAIADGSLRRLAYPASPERIKYCCRSPAEWELYKSFAPIAARLDEQGLASSEAGKSYFDMAGRAMTSVSRLYTQSFGHPQGDSESGLEHRLHDLVDEA
ncbi:MAG: hypothetical protein E7813_03430 [Bradyrhizobium sp.]|uniref:hypothetical protein n=1 Tax=Bradyrhizobium sp. TaxID=376 RepID=UPI0012271C20|nr:hypothetical protein [Bradyrhizobium sp.]THD73081.1 MAG: hypothetical protein E7813_03430 [Bradyrhizobium sp.]